MCIGSGCFSDLLVVEAATTNCQAVAQGADLGYVFIPLSASTS